MTAPARLRFEAGSARVPSDGLELAPMVSVAFLMLAFLLITASLHGGEAGLRPPQATGGSVSGGGRLLHIEPDGTLRSGTLRGAEALSSLSGPDPVRILVDRDVEARHLAAALGKLRDRDIPTAELLVRPR